MQLQEIVLYKEDGKWLCEVEAENLSVSHSIKGPAGRVCVQLGEFYIGKLRGELDFNDKSNTGELVFTSESLSKNIVIPVGQKKKLDENLIPLIKESLWVIK